MAPRANKNQPPSWDDQESYRRMEASVKARILYSYLYEGLVMEEVARKVLGATDQSATQSVSVVMRCCGFSGENYGHYHSGRRGGLDLILELKDFEDFAAEYPNGCPHDWPNHETIDAFMEQRDWDNRNPELSRQRPQRQSAQDQQVRKSLEWGKAALSGAGGGLRAFLKWLRDKLAADGGERLPQGYSWEEFRGILFKVLLAAAALFILISFRVGPFAFITPYYSQGITGLFEVCSTVTFYFPIIYLIVNVVKKKFRRGLGIALPIFVLSTVFADLADGFMDDALIMFLIAGALCLAGKWFADRK